MLKEMGVQVWFPQKAPEVSDDIKSSKIDFNNKIVEKNNKNTIINIANNTINTRLNSDKINDEILSNLNLDKIEGIASLNWPALQQAVSGCRACQLCESRSQTVFGVGQPAPEGVAPQADWLIVGEAPGENEDRVGEPFVGQAGQLLDNMLKAMNLSRRSGASGGVYIANVIKCRPPGNRNPTPEEVAQCEPYLHRQIALLQPKMILAMGKYAATSLLRATVPDVDKTPLGKLRGRVHAYSHAGLTTPVVATYHPAYLLRSLTEKAKAWEDLCLALDSLDTGARANALSP